MIDVRYAELCSLCGGDIEREEIEKGVCKEENKSLCYFEEDRLFQEFSNFFERGVGELRELQKSWAKRVLRGKSFAAVAPTGIGKSTLGIAVALFLAERKKKCYLIFPTTLLVQQVVERAEEMAKKVGCSLKILYYHGRLKNNEKEEFFEKLEAGDFDALITTSQFLVRNFEKLREMIFNFIFVDDVDSILKNSRNIDRILHLLGFRYEGMWKGKAKGVLMVSTATAKKGKRASLFHHLLNFDIGSSRHTIRDVVDVYMEGEEESRVKNLLSALESGGLIYARSVDECKRWYEVLKTQFRVGIVSSGEKEDFKLFKGGKLDFLIGTSHYYGALIRGIDLPMEIKYAIFIGAPVSRIKVEDIDNASPGIIKLIASLFREEEEVKKFLPMLPSIERRKEFQDLKNVIKKMMEGEARGKDFVLRKGELIFPDVRIYIQGSGRTSRLLADGITKGASFLMEEDKEVMRAFIERATYYDIHFIKFEEVNLEELKKGVIKSREKRRKKAITPALFVVESPTKAKQIARFFGKPSIKVVDGSISYEVAGEEHIFVISASLGHVVDLITGRGFHGVEVNGKFIPIYASIKKCMDCNYQFTEGVKKCVRCGSKNISDSRDRIEALRNLAYEAGEIFIGTDPDSEGEKIAWDIANMLKNCGEVKRVEFHEITPRAIKEAFRNAREVDENRVKAQIVRRIEDRWIGFVLSEKLWKKFNNRNLSAGRAQTPVLGWIIEREREYREKKIIGIVEDFDITLEEVKGKEIQLQIEMIEEREEEKTPLPPYTTDELLRDASRILKLSATKTMQIAQDLFERGLITYHRTDSTRVGEMGLKVAKEYLGGDFVMRRFAMEGAHECIRPTRPWDKNLLRRLLDEKVLEVEDVTEHHLALYDLILRRFMASQCRNYYIRVKKYRIKYNGKEMEEERVVKAEGKAYYLYRSVIVKKELPVGVFKRRVKVISVSKKQRFTQSEIIKEMKDKGIGRPSTYATIIEKLFMRGYIREVKGRIVPTKKGMEVYEFLNKNYGKFVGEERTRKMEEEMDMVMSGKEDYMKVLEKLYEEMREIG